MTHKHTSLNRTIIILLALALSGALVASFSRGMLAAIVAVLILAFAKGWFVVLDFMEMRVTRGALKSALLAWPAILLTLALARSVAVRFFL
ncbi:cytochrome C oxidase subunit IV family protein [Brucella pseudogrignonensis]|uniref:Nitric oxide reductase NorF protein n=1 Tax=Brucella pseudogrignonensis TaxID=419475 RepID=A0ABU1MB27_9HYPH|nr:cytochrome C oxidase subunit IV family protein [Brucella pseudogrignonensis]MDR6433245.1 nitric oxide reductase NorF protein [Brucella pseudogrignonensis]